MISNNERINLQKLVGEFESDDNTASIRELKHSSLMRRDIEAIVANPQAAAMDVAPFLYANYTDIFHRVVKGDLDMSIMTKVLDILALIEDGRVDQHEGSVLVGRVLKEMFLDSAVRRADRLDIARGTEEPPAADEGKAVSWKEFKSQQQA